MSNLFNYLYKKYDDDKNNNVLCRDMYGKYTNQYRFSQKYHILNIYHYYDTELILGMFFYFKKDCMHLLINDVEKKNVKIDVKYSTVEFNNVEKKNVKIYVKYNIVEFKHKNKTCTIHNNHFKYINKYYNVIIDYNQPGQLNQNKIKIYINTMSKDTFIMFG